PFSRLPLYYSELFDAKKRPWQSFFFRPSTTKQCSSHQSGRPRELTQGVRLCFAWFVSFVIKQSGGGPLAVLHDEVPGSGLSLRLFRAQEVRRVEFRAGNLRFVIKHQQSIDLAINVGYGSIDPELPGCRKQIVNGTAFTALNTIRPEKIAVKVAALALQ